MCRTCKGTCEMNPDGIIFYPQRYARYDQGMKSCSVCEKAWVTIEKTCQCCSTRLKIKKRDKNDTPEPKLCVLRKGRFKI
jgi:uncharacterized paraquat-inducible protein A